MLSKELKKQIKEATEKLIWEDKKRKELLNTNIDYNYLQTLIDRVNSNPDLLITIRFKSGDTMELRSQYEEYNTDYNQINGAPTVEEIR